MSIGGVHNTAESVSRLHTVRTYGEGLEHGSKSLLIQSVMEHSRSDPSQSWVEQTCATIGSKTDGVRPPSDAISAVKSLPTEYTQAVEADVPLPQA